MQPIPEWPVMAGCSPSRSGPRVDLLGGRLAFPLPLWAKRVNLGNRPSAAIRPIRSKQSPAVDFQYASVAPAIGIAPATVHSSDTLGTARRSGVGSIASEKLLVATSIDA